MPSPVLTFHQVTDEHRHLVNRFYKANGHRGKCGSNDLVFVAKNSDSIVAAVRYTPKGSTSKTNGYLLRGLWVASPLRKLTIGQQLLSYSLAEQDTCVWCYPYEYLVNFYARSGFTEVLPENVPDTISAPWQAYRNRGETFALMQFLPPALKLC